MSGRGHPGEVVHSYSEEEMAAFPEELDKKEAQFIDRVVQAVNDDLEDHDPIESMENLQGHDKYAEPLVDDDFLKMKTKGRLAQYHRVFYAPKGSKITDNLHASLSQGEGYGDLGEGCFHRIFTEYTYEYYAQQAFNAFKYFGADELKDYEGDERKPDVIDVYVDCGPARDNHVIEIELALDYEEWRGFRKEYIIRDLEKLASYPGLAIWVLEDKETRNRFLEALEAEEMEEAVREYIESETLRKTFLELCEENDGGLIPEIVNKENKTTEEIIQTIAVPGLDEIVHFKDIYDAVVGKEEPDIDELF